MNLAAFLPWALPPAVAAAILLIAGAVGAFLRRLRQRPLRPVGMASWLGRSGFSDGLFYGLYFIKYWTALMLGGAVLGVATYLVMGPVFLPEGDWALRLSKGVANGIFFVGLVWGPGIALVSCFVKAHRLLNPSP